jgi:spore maturation protein CgeB
MVKALSASKIVLNIHDEQDLRFKTNMRVFEATGSGCFLLTDRPYGIDKMYVPEKEVACFDDESELPKLIRKYLDDPAVREEVLQKGQARAYHDHTYDQRIETLFRKIL